MFEGRAGRGGREEGGRRRADTRGGGRILGLADHRIRADLEAIRQIPNSYSGEYIGLIATAQSNNSTSSAKELLDAGRAQARPLARHAHRDEEVLAVRHQAPPC